jgi:hypothetical protein
MSLAPLRPPLVCALCAMVLAAQAVACGDDDGGGSSDVVGLYNVTSYVRQAGDCEGEGDPVEDAAVLRLVRGQLFGLPVLQGYVCAVADGCGEAGGLSTFIFVERRGATWVTEASAASYGGAACALTYSLAVLTPVTGGLRIESTASSGEFPLTEAQCEPDAVASRRNELTCFLRQHLEATSRAD